MIEVADRMPPDIVRTMRTCQEFARRETTFPVGYDDIGAMIDPPEITGPRLEALRLALGFETQTAFAQKLGLGKNTYNAYETGARSLSFTAACKIRRRFNVPLDFLFYGDGADRLQAHVYQKLVKAGIAA